MSNYLILYFLRNLFNIYFWDRIYRSPLGHHCNYVSNKISRYVHLFFLKLDTALVENF